MLDYVIDLLDDATDFSWASTKASHAVLLCRMEQGEIKSWSETVKIHRVRRAHAQRHTTALNNTQKGQDKSSSGKVTTCVFYNKGTCAHKQTHRVQKARTVLNSRYSDKDFLTLSRWSKADIKQKFESAMTIFKVRDHRTYAQALLSKHDNGHKSDTGRITAHHTTPQGDQNALKQLVVNTDSNTFKVKESIVNINKQNYHNVGHNYMAKQDKAGNSKANLNCGHKELRPNSRQVSECYPISTSNRFQLLDNNHEVQVNTTGEVDSKIVDRYVCEQQLQTYPGIQQTIVQPDPKRTVADPCVIPENVKIRLAPSLAAFPWPLYMFIRVLQHTGMLFQIS